MSVTLAERASAALLSSLVHPLAPGLSSCAFTSIAVSSAAQSALNAPAP